MNLEELGFHNETKVTSKKTQSLTSDLLLLLTYSRETCIIIFTVITFSMVTISLIGSATFVSVCMKASINLHNNMFNSITKATMYFFNTNSSGKIITKKLFNVCY